MSEPIKPVAGFDLSPSELDDVLHRLCFFAPTGSGTYLRELHEFLVLQGLASLPETPQSARDIHRKVRKLVGPHFEFEEMLEALGRLATSDRIHCTGQRYTDVGARFQLPIDLRSELLSQVEREQVLERQVIDKWKVALEQKYPDLPVTNLDTLESDLKLFALRLLSQHSAETVALYYGGQHELETLIQNVYEQGLDNIWPHRRPELAAIRKREVIAFFRELTDERRRYIASLMHSLFLLQLSTLDSQSASVLREKVPGGLLYLDTNYVFRLVGLQGPDLYLASQRLADISKQLGYKLVVSARTKLEYEASLRNCLRDLVGRPPLTSDLARLAYTATSDEDFLTAYWRHISERGAYIDPQEYYSYYQQLEALLEPYEAIIDDTYHQDLIERDAEIAREASLLRSVMASSFGERVADRTSDHVLEHDGYHRLLIQLLRDGGVGEERFTTVTSWFLTCDSKLPLYDRVARGRQSGKLPFCVVSGQWLQTLRPFVEHSELLDSAQVDMLVSPLLRAYQRPPAQLINSVASRIALSATYSLPAVSAMFSNRQFLEQYEAADTDEAQQDLIDNFYADYAVEIEREKNEIEKERDEVISERDLLAYEYEQKAHELEQTHAELEQERLRRHENEVMLTSKIAEVERQKTASNTVEQQLEKATTAHVEQLRKVKRQNVLQTVFVLVIVALWAIYYTVRQPSISTSNAFLELIASIGLVLYLVAGVLIEIWKSVGRLVIFFVVPLLFVVSIFMPSRFANILQVFDVLLAIVLVAYDRFRTSSVVHT